LPSLFVYVAVIVCGLPVAESLVGRLATPLFKVTGAPTFVPSTANCTAPVGAPKGPLELLTTATRATA
jgi:hypothetical protein